MPTIRPARPAWLLLAALLGLGSLAHAAWADDAVVVLDRGAGAKAHARDLEQTALRLVEALEDRGHAVRLTLYGTRPDGRVRASRLSGDLPDRIGRAAAKEGWRYEGATDPRVALEVALRGHTGSEPLVVVLVGPFGAPADETAEAADGDVDEADGEGDHETDSPDEAPSTATRGAEALEAWEEEAPPATRVFAPHLGRRDLRRISAARGVVTGGAIVLGAGEAVATPHPWSPLDRAAPLEAEVAVALDVLVVGVGTRRPLLDATSSDGGSQVRWLTPDGAPPGAGGAASVQRFEVRRDHREDAASRVETIAFAEATSPTVLWLCDAPQPRTIQWTELAPDARVAWFTPTTTVDPAPVDDTRPLDADPLHVGSPRVRIARIEHTRVGETPTWTVRAAEGALPPGLTTTLGDVVNRSEAIAYRELEIRFAARPGESATLEGTLVIESVGHPRRFEVPYRVVIPPGRVIARLTAPETAWRLPAGDDDAPWSLEVEELRPNAPPLVRLEAELDPPALAEALTARLVGAGSVEVAWDLTGPLELRPGRRYELHLDLAPGVREVAGTLALRLPSQRGVEGEAEGSGRVVSRSPRLVVASEDWAYRMDDGEVVAEPPLVLEVDPDGGGGDWRLALLRTVPEPSVPDGAPIAFVARPEAPGRWALLPEGSWNGERGDTFAARTERVPVEIAWAAGTSPDTLEVTVEVRPRWGVAGWILVGLAGLASLLGLWSLLQMRAAPVDGTLLYQMEGRAGAVGRLDLAPSGRRTTVVHPDAAGRLVLAVGRRAEAEPVVLIRPTRVGAMMEIPSRPMPERHLLVDGLTIQVGAYRLRYVSGRAGDGTVATVPGPTEELLGPEFDMPTGRFDALDAESPPMRHEAPDDEPGEAPPGPPEGA